MSINIENKKYAMLKEENLTKDSILLTRNGNYYPEDNHAYNLVRVKVIPDYEIEIEPSIENQTFRYQDYSEKGFSKITVKAIDSDLDPDLVPENIRENVTIFGVTGTLTELVGESISIDPSTEIQYITPSSGYNAITNVTVNPVTYDIDGNILAENIKQGITILSIEGSVIELNSTDLTINPSTISQTITPSEPYNAYNEITVNPVTSSIDPNISANNIKQGVIILGVEGSSEEVNLTTINITENGTYTPSSPYNGFSSVDVDINTVNNTDITITDSGIYSASSPYTGYGTVTVDLSWIEQALESLNAGDTEVPINLQDKTVTVSGIYSHDPGYDGLGNVTVDLSWVDQAIISARNEASDATIDRMVADNSRFITTDSDYVRDYAFYRLTSLEKLILNNAQSIGQYAFAYTSLSELYIYTPSVCTLSSTTAFTNTNITHIYVPTNLVNTYKNANYWSSYSSKISAIS